MAKDYDYICEKCGKIIIHTSESIMDEKPKRKKCPDCGTMTCIYDWNQTRQSATHIPDYMRAGNEKTKYNKIPKNQQKWKGRGI